MVVSVACVVQILLLPSICPMHYTVADKLKFGGRLVVFLLL